MSKHPHLTLVVSNELSCDESRTGRAETSLGRTLDPYALRVDLPERWRAYVTERFGSYEVAATFFGVTGQTALNWFEGLHRPSADKLLLAALADPDGFEAHFRAPYLGQRAA